MGLNPSLLSLREANLPLIQSGSRSTRSIRRINGIPSDLFFDLLVAIPRKFFVTGGIDGRPRGTFINDSADNPEFLILVAR